MINKRVLSEVWNRYNSVSNNSQNQYIISNQQNNKERELNMQNNIKTADRKKLWLQVLIDLEYTYTRIKKQLVKKGRIKMKLAV